MELISGCSSSVERSVWDREAGGPIPLTPTKSFAGVVQWQNATFPKLSREFDSLHPLRKGVRKADGRLALRGKGCAELCKAQIVTWHQPPIS